MQIICSGGIEVDQCHIKMYFTTDRSLGVALAMQNHSGSLIMTAILGCSPPIARKTGFQMKELDKDGSVRCGQGIQIFL